MDFSRYHGKAFAVVLDDISGRKRVLRGIAACETIQPMGRVMRISFDADQDPGATALIIEEDQWSDAIRIDRRYGCDYAVRLRRHKGQPASQTKV